MSEERRRENNKERVLTALQHQGKIGCTNEQLLHIGGFRYGARIFELRQEGWLIETSAGEGGAFKFVLKGRVGEEQQQQNLFV